MPSKATQPAYIISSDGKKATEYKSKVFAARDFKKEKSKGARLVFKTGPGEYFYADKSFSYPEKVDDQTASKLSQAFPENRQDNESLLAFNKQVRGWVAERFPGQQFESTDDLIAQLDGQQLAEFRQLTLAHVMGKEIEEKFHPKPAGKDWRMQKAGRWKAKRKPANSDTLAPGMYLDMTDYGMKGLAPILSVSQGADFHVVVVKTGAREHPVQVPTNSRVYIAESVNERHDKGDIYVARWTNLPSSMTKKLSKHGALRDNEMHRINKVLNSAGIKMIWKGRNDPSGYYTSEDGSVQIRSGFSTGDGKHVKYPRGLDRESYRNKSPQKSYQAVYWTTVYAPLPLLRKMIKAVGRTPEHGVKPWTKRQRESIEEGVYDPYVCKAVWMAGSFGAGKSFIAEKAFAGMGLKVVSSDRFLELMIKRAGKDLKKDVFSPEVQMPGGLRDQSVDKADKQRDMWAAGRLGLIIDGSGTRPDKVARQREALEKLGYDCAMVFVETPVEHAIANDARRARTLGEPQVRKAHAQAMANKERYRKEFGPYFAVVKNDKILTPDQQIKKLVPKLHKVALKLIGGHIRNPLGKAWVEYEKIKKGGKARMATVESDDEERQPPQQKPVKSAKQLDRERKMAMMVSAITNGEYGPWPCHPSLIPTYARFAIAEYMFNSAKPGSLNWGHEGMQQLLNMVTSKLQATGEEEQAAAPGGEDDEEEKPEPSSDSGDTPAFSGSKDSKLHTQDPPEHRIGAKTEK